jgi:hypothetical protein
MGAIRKVYYTICLLLPIAYLTLAMDHGNIESLVLWSSILTTVGGVIVIATYEGPPVSELRTNLLGRPPVMARMMVLIYGFVAGIMVFNALGLGQFFR